MEQQEINEQIDLAARVYHDAGWEAIITVNKLTKASVVEWIGFRFQKIGDTMVWQEIENKDGSFSTVVAIVQ